MVSRSGGWKLWLAAAAAFLVVAVLLAVLVPSSSPGGTPTPTPTTTPAATGSTTVTPLPTDTSGPPPTDTSGPPPTDTSGPQPTDTSGPQPTDTSGPQPTDTSGPHEVYFEYGQYNQGTASDGSGDFWTRINITFPLCYFYGAQFDLDWDPSLVHLLTAYTMGNGRGRLWNGSAWFPATNLGITLQGPEQFNKQGHCIVLTDWDAYTVLTGGDGINASAGYIVELRWRPQGNTGVTALGFAPLMLLAGLSIEAIDFEIPASWTNTSISCQ